MPLVQTRGAASAQGFGEFAQAAPTVNWIDDVFSTYLYTGNASTQTITNGIDLAGKGGLTWIKKRSAFSGHALFDTTRGVNNYLVTSSIGAQNVYGSYSNLLTSFNSNGFSLGADSALDLVNSTSGQTFVGWTFREQAKFFDVVTYTGNGDADRNIAHSLGSVPGMIFIKKTSGTGNWATAASLSSTAYGIGGGGSGSGYEFSLNLSDGYYDNPLKSTIATDTTVNVPRVYYNNAAICNQSGANYVMYLFASNAGGFGTAGTDNVISCGSFTSSGSVTSVTLGYEPQFVLIKRADGAGGWLMFDTMRGYTVQGQPDNYLLANVADAEVGGSNYGGPTATGFDWYPSGTQTYIYMAIRRPMKPPTSGTEVFSPNAFNEALGVKITTGFPVDLQWIYGRPGGTPNSMDRLRGVSTNSTGRGLQLQQTNTNAETAAVGNGSLFWDNTGFQTSNDWKNYSNIAWNFKRASGFHDIVCYTGTGSARTVTHNLGVVPELMIVKYRDVGSSNAWWAVYSSALGASNYLRLNFTDASASSSTLWNATTPTASVFSVGSAFQTNDGSGAYVAYLFATLAGVSKVGSYTGNGGTQAIACGFTGGARFVLIKRTDATGDWYVYDTARGMTLLTDPYLLLNSTAAETATLGSVTTTTGGFTVDATILAAINTNAASYIFLAIA